jgi:hypothetical protein
VATAQLRGGALAEALVFETRWFALVADLQVLAGCRTWVLAAKERGLDVETALSTAAAQIRDFLEIFNWNLEVFSFYF